MCKTTPFCRAVGFIVAVQQLDILGEQSKASQSSNYTEIEALKDDDYNAFVQRSGEACMVSVKEKRAHSSR